MHKLCFHKLLHSKSSAGIPEFLSRGSSYQNTRLGFRVLGTNHILYNPAGCNISSSSVAHMGALIVRPVFFGGGNYTVITIGALQQCW